MIKQVTFKNSRNETMHGVLKKKNDNGPLLIVSHGFKSSKDHPANTSITDALYAMGHTTFSFNFSKSAQGFNLIEQIADVKDIVGLFKEYDRCIILAGSFGALGGAIASVQSPQIKGLITINGFFGSGQLGLKLLKPYVLFRIFSFFNNTYKKNWRYFKTHYQPQKIRVKTLVIHAKNDGAVSITQSEGFFKKLGGEKEFYVLEQGDHHLTKEAYRQEVAHAIDAWVKKSFK